jgi:hypothetical protein
MRASLRSVLRCAQALGRGRDICSGRRDVWPPRTRRPRRPWSGTRGGVGTGRTANGRRPPDMRCHLSIRTPSRLCRSPRASGRNDSGVRGIHLGRGGTGYWDPGNGIRKSWSQLPVGRGSNISNHPLLLQVFRQHQTDRRHHPHQLPPGGSPLKSQAIQAIGTQVSLGLVTEPFTQRYHFLGELPFYRVRHRREVHQGQHLPRMPVTTRRPAENHPKARRIKVAKNYLFGVKSRRD